jgi:2-hydroxy-6-oxo-6-(2'-aminophenyl)hexa-2,4-dienoate hydrolase
MKAQAATMQWVKQQGGLYIDEELIRTTRVPTLVVGGKCDPIVTPRQIFRFLELIDDSRGYLIPYCGHWVMMERPEEFADLCTQFILR